MEKSNSSSNDSKINASINKRKNTNNKKYSSKIIKNKIRKQNPSVFSFTTSSSFIYEPKLSKKILRNVSDKNSIKPTELELNFLEKTIHEIDIQNSENNSIYVTPFFSLVMNNLKKVEKTFDNKALLIQTIIKENANNGHISIRKITEKYNTICQEKNLKKISKVRYTE